MRLWLIGCALLFVLGGGQSAAVAQMPPQVDVTSLRAQLKQMLEKTPYVAPDAEICAMATAIFVRAAQAEPELVEPHVGGVDCGQAFADAGFALWTAGSGESFKRVYPPGQLQ